MLLSIVGLGKERRVQCRLPPEICRARARPTRLARDYYELRGGLGLDRCLRGLFVRIYIRVAPWAQSAVEDGFGALEIGGLLFGCW